MLACRNACNGRVPRAALATAVLLFAASFAAAQDMEPRAYSSSPVGLNFLAVVAGNTSGAILFDPSLPITDVHSNLDTAALGYGRTFSFFGKQALVLVGIPYARGHVEGQVQEVARRVERSGFADPRIKLSVNFLGPKAMHFEEYRKARHRTIVGGSITVQVPVGEYDPTKLINLGTNRFAIKPEVGVSVPVGRWYLDAYAGVWLFEENDDFFPGGAHRDQDPLYAVQGHASYTFKNRVWVALDATWFGGGEATVDGGPPSTRQSNTRIGATLSVPLTARQSLKFAGSTGAATRTGSDFDTILVGWQLSWFDPSERP
jgi:hypothetical protein